MARATRVLFLIMGVSAGVGWASESPEVAGLEEIRPHGLRAHMRFLADDLLEGRGTGARGYDVAARYVAARFAELGLEPAGTGGGYLQPVRLLRAWPLPAESRFEVRRGARRERLEHGRDFSWSPDFLRAESRVENAELVFVGFGVSAPERGYDDYAGVDCRGKVVLMARGAPSTFDHNQRAYYAASEVKRQSALDRGAIAILGLRDPARPPEKPGRWEELVRFSTAAGDLTWVNAAGRPDRGDEALLAQARLSPLGAQRLLGREARRVDAALARAAKGTPASFALRARVDLVLRSRQAEAASANVAARLEGTDLAHEEIVYSAHLDHLGVDPSAPAGADAVYNGAYDNASGIAALIEIARAFASREPPRRSIVFLAVTGEEEGLLGSEAYLDARPPAGEAAPGRIVANLNLDMFLMLYPLSDVVAFGAEHSTLGAFAERAAAQVGLELSPDPYPEEVIFVRSDQFAFVRQGIPALFVVSGSASADPAVDGEKVTRAWIRNVYHTAADDLTQPFDHESGARFARANFLIGWQAANAAEPPSWNPGDFFGERFAPAAPAAGARP
jgi:hypothetical protein